MNDIERISWGRRMAIRILLLVARMVEPHVSYRADIERLAKEIADADMNAEDSA